MLVTFNSSKRSDAVEAELELPNSTHTLGFRNLSNMPLLRHIQGRRGIHFCSSYAAPEGAHDPSFLSGLVVVRAIGADYLFDSGERPALADFH